jgi:hypothetical protein
MNPVEPMGSTPAIYSAPVHTGAPATSIPGLPFPLFDGAEPNDALSMMLMAMERSGQIAMEGTETRIRHARAALKEQLDAFLQKLQESLEAAKRAQEEEDDGGFFGYIVDAVADVVATIVGTIADFTCDMITTPLELTIDVAKNLGDTQALLAAVRSDMLDLVENGEVADSVGGFTSGVLAFTGDLAVFGAEVSAALAEAAATGKDPMAALEDPLKALWSSCKRNILDNPQFWEVAGVVAKAAAVAGAVATGGVLGAAALVALAALEVDQRTDFIEKTVGEEAAPWVRLGLGVAASTCLAIGATGSSELGNMVRIVNGTTSIVQGAGSAYQGYRTIVSGQERGDEIDRQTHLQTMRNRMDQLQRLVSSLIDLLGEQNEDRNTRQQIGTDLVATKASMQQAALFPA